MEIAFVYSGTCTLIEGPGGNSSAYFIRIFFAGFPHLVILFCYVMIIRKVKESRREALLRSSARSRSREQASEDSLTTRQINYFKNLLSKKYKEEQRRYPWKVRRVRFCEVQKLDIETATIVFPFYIDYFPSEDSECGPTVSPTPQPLRLYNMEKIRKRKKQEDQLTFTVGVIFVVYVLCNLPASIVLLIDPSATKITQVRPVSLCHPKFLLCCYRLTFPATYWLGYLLLSSHVSM